MNARVPPTGGAGVHDVETRLCSDPDCTRTAFRVGLCQTHYRLTGKGRGKPAPCTAPGCARVEPLTLGLCNAHYQAQARILKAQRLAVLNPPVPFVGVNDGPCANDPAHGKAFRVGLCSPCYLATGKGGKPTGPCPECGDGVVKVLYTGVCTMHYQRIKRAKKPRGKIQTRTTTADLVRLVLVIEQAASGVGKLLKQADGGPLPWPVVEERLLEVHAVLGAVRRKMDWRRAILDMEHAEDLP
jgi:hypothetical protein